MKTLLALLLIGLGFLFPQATTNQGQVAPLGNQNLTPAWIYFDVQDFAGDGTNGLFCSSSLNFARGGGLLTIASQFQTQTCSCPIYCTGSPKNVTQNYTTGDAYNPTPFLYGTFEARMEFPAAENHAAFWTLETNCEISIGCHAPDATYREIDIAEVFSSGDSNTAGNRIHVRQNVFGSSSHTFLLGTTTTSSDFSANFHVYRAVWTPTLITFYVDGTQTNSISNAASPSSFPTQPMNIFVTSYIDNIVTTPTSTDYPVTMKVSYVKHWDVYGNLDFDWEF